MCALLVLAFLFLRPAEDEAADGTMRVAPTTTTTIAPTTTTTLPEEAQAGVSELIATDQVVFAAEVEASNRLSRIVFTDRYVGLSSAEAGDAPPLLESEAGLVWTPIDTTLDRSDEAPATPILWAGLTDRADGLALFGFQELTFRSREVAVSQDGVDWEVLPSNIDSQLTLSPFAVTEDAVVFVETINAVQINEAQTNEGEAD